MAAAIAVSVGSSRSTISRPSGPERDAQVAAAAVGDVEIEREIEELRARPRTTTALSVGVAALGGAGAW